MRLCICIIISFLAFSCQNEKEDKKQGRKIVGGSSRRDIVDTSTAKHVKPLLFVNGNKTNIPAFSQPSTRSAIKDYLQPNANIHITKTFFSKETRTYWYYGEIGWIPKKLLKKVNVLYLKKELERAIPIGQFFSVSGKKKNDALTAIKKGVDYRKIMRTILKGVKYLDINSLHLDIALIKGIHEQREYGFLGIINRIISKNKPKYIITAYGKKTYPDFFNGHADASSFYSKQMPYKESSHRLFSVALIVKSKDEIIFDGDKYIRLK